ncbi:MAG: hypothetical protein CSB44_03465 [Gammaproteobacteria bacterium]|nr:MAG: hypothetical protein CSB44_03465 [Gammaproteobacteria bacterium]
MARLTRIEAQQRLHSLRGNLTALQYRTLQGLAELISQNRDISADQARKALGNLAPEAAREFRSSVNSSFTDAGADLRLESTGPDNNDRCFEGDNPATERMVAHSANAARQMLPKNPIEADAVEKVDATVIHIVASREDWGAEDSPTRKLAKLIQDHAAASKDKYIITSPADVLAGEKTAEVEDSLLRSAHAIVVLQSTRLVSETEKCAALRRHATKTVVVPLEDGASDAKDCTGERPFFPGKPWLRVGFVRGYDFEEQQFIRDIFNEIGQTLSPEPWPQPNSDPHLHNATTEVDVEEEGQIAGSTAGQNNEVDYSWLGDSPDSMTSPSLTPVRVPAVARLVDWATSPEPTEPVSAAILGGVGMGKSTTVARLTRELIQLHENDPSVPLPILLDLGKPEAAEISDKSSRDIVQQVLVNSATGLSEPVCIDDLQDVLSSERTLVIVDGLDEALARLELMEGQNLIQDLCDTVFGAGKASTRLLWACRSHCFCAMVAESTPANVAGSTPMNAEGRQDAPDHGFLLLHMLPLTPRQIKGYLADNLGSEAAANRAWQMMESVYDLQGLAQHPDSLKLIQESLKPFEGRATTDAPLTSAGLYEMLVDQWLANDHAKRQLDPEHEKQLLGELAHRLWTTNRRSWTATDIDRLLADHPAEHLEMARSHDKNVPSLWQQDLRASAFVLLARDRFSFAHAPLLEFFLAQRLVAALTEPSERCVAIWGSVVPSPECLHFLAEIVSRHEDRDELLSAMQQAAATDSAAAQTILAYALTGARIPDAQPSLAGAMLAGSKLTRKVVVGIDFRRADLAGSSLANCVFETCDFSNAQLSAATLTGTRFRHCDLFGVDLSDASTSFTEIIWCENVMDTPGLLVAPVADVPDATASPATLSAHTDSIVSCCFNHDNTRILTTSRDGTARLWNPATGRCIQTLTGHTGQVSRGSFNHDGTRILTTGVDGTARLWNPTTGQCLQILDRRHAQTHDGLTNSVTGIVFGHDGTLILTTSRDDAARIRNPASGLCIYTLKGQFERITSGILNHDGTLILTTHKDGIARIWNPTTGHCLHALMGQTKHITSGCFNHDGTRVLTICRDGSACIWSPDTGRCIQTLTEDTGKMRSGSFNHDGTRIMTTSFDGIARIWNANNGECLHTLKGHNSEINGGLFNHDGSRILTTSHDGTAHIWSPGTGRCLHTLIGHTRNITSGCFNHDGTRIVTTGFDGSARIWNPDTGRCVHTFEGHGRSVESGSFNHDDTQILTTCRDGTAHIWNPDTGTRLHTLEGHTEWLHSGSFNHDGTQALTVDNKNTARIWNPNTGQCLHTLRGHRVDLLASGSFNHDGTRVLTICRDGSARIWSTDTGRCLHTLSNDSCYVDSGSFNHDSTEVLLVSFNGIAHIWEPDTGKCLRILEEHTALLGSGIYDPNGTQILTIIRCRSACIWNPRTADCIQTFTGHTNDITSCAFNHDSTRLLTTSRDATARIWDTKSGQCLRILEGHTSTVTDGSFSHDGTKVLTTSSDGTARIWCDGRVELIIEFLPENDYAVRDGSGKLLAVSDRAWRWLGYAKEIDGKLVPLPAEYYGELVPGQSWNPATP